MVLNWLSNNEKLVDRSIKFSHEVTEIVSGVNKLDKSITDNLIDSGFDLVSDLTKHVKAASQKGIVDTMPDEINQIIENLVGMKFSTKTSIANLVTIRNSLFGEEY